MDHFGYAGGTLCAEDVSLAEVAARFGTPTYVYARATLQRHVEVLRRGLGELPHRICYAVKANGNLALLQVLHRLGCNFDAVSGGELLRVGRAGAPASGTIFSGVGKSDQEIRLALQLGVLYLSVESEAELVAIGEVAREMNVVAPVSLRINPDVDAKTHPYISTGMAENKFGVPTEAVPALVRLAVAHPHLELCGLSCHIGSQITELSPFRDAARRLATQVGGVQATGVTLRHVGMGGGLGIPYNDESPPDPAAYGAALGEVLAPLQREIVLEPGRVLVGNAGVLLTRVVRCKQHGPRAFVLVDAGMNDLMRPALYQAHHRIVPVAQPAPGASDVVVDVVGPVCESADTFGRAIALPQLRPGDLLAIRSAGAYGSVMASNYNGRPRPAEVLCDGARVQLVGRREAPEELWRLEADLLADGAGPK